MRALSTVRLLSHAVIAAAGLALLSFLSACDSVPSGPGVHREPKTTDQLIPLHSGNTWHYRDLVSGSTAPDDPYIITTVPKFIYAYAVAPGGEATCYMLDWYTDGTRAWSVTYSGVLIGMMASPEVARVQRSVPKDPKADVAYSYDRDLLCLGTDAVATPAGSFTCYHFRLTGTGSEYWWARGVGLVQKKTMGPDGTITEHWVLESYRLNNR